MLLIKIYITHNYTVLFILITIESNEIAENSKYIINITVSMMK